MASNKALEEAKSLVSEKYLGRAGIHGVSLRRSRSAITLYIDPAEQAERQEVLRSIEEEIKPFKLLVVEEERASIK